MALVVYTALGLGLFFVMLFDKKDSDHKHWTAGLGPEYLVLVLVALEYLMSVLILVLRPEES